MRTKRIPVGRAAMVLFLSVLLLGSVIWICGDALLGPAWSRYIGGEAAAMLGHRSTASAAVTVTVPDMTAMPFSADALDGDLFGLSVTYVSDESSPRTVLSQSPAPGTRRRAVPGVKRVPVHVTVSTGLQTAVLPDIYGTEGRQAESLLRAAGFSVTVITLTQDGPRGLRSAQGERFRYVPRGTLTVPSLGTAVFTEPQPGSALRAGTEVTLYVMADTPHKPVICPDTVGMTLREAFEALSEAGVRIGQLIRIPDGSVSDTVLAQSRLAGTTLSPDDTVNLTVAAATLPQRHFRDIRSHTKSKG